MEATDTSQPVEEIAAELLVLFHLQDEPAPRGHLGRVDWILCSPISRLRARGKFAAAWGTSVLLVPQIKMRAERILILGLGVRADLGMTDLYRLSYQTAQTVLNLHCTRIALELPFRAFPQEPRERIRRGFLEGFLAELKRGRPEAAFEVSLLPAADRA